MSWNDQELNNDKVVLMRSKREGKTKLICDRSRARLARDVDLFLKKGGIINKLPSVQEPGKPMLDIHYRYN